MNHSFHFKVWKNYLNSVKIFPYGSSCNFSEISFWFTRFYHSVIFTVTDSRFADRGTGKNVAIVNSDPDFKLNFNFETLVFVQIEISCIFK